MPKATIQLFCISLFIYLFIVGEKPYKCTECSSAFVRHGHLQRHMLTHAEEKPYKCKTCPKSFTQYRNLQTHMYKHTGKFSIVLLVYSTS